MARRRRRQSGFVSQAALEALVRYGPEESGLTALIRQAEDNRSSTIKQARGTASGIISAVNQARPEVADVYRDARRTQAHVADVGGDPASISNDAIRSGVEWERQGQASRLAESRASALSELSERKVSAQSGRQFAVQTAQREFKGEIAKVLQRAQDLQREKGAFTAATAQELQQAAQDRQDKLRINREDNSQSERNSLRSAGINPDTGKPIPGGKLDPKADREKKKWATPAAQSRAQETLGEALAHAKDLKEKFGGSRHEVAVALLKGDKDREVPVYETYEENGKKKQRRKLNPDGTPVTQVIPGVPKIKDQLLLSAALDVAFDGHLSRRNQKLLHDNGIRIGPLGVTTYRQWKRKQKPFTVQRPSVPRGSRPT